MALQLSNIRKHRKILILMTGKETEPTVSEEYEGAFSTERDTIAK